jgi:hypothetical protein
MKMPDGPCLTVAGICANDAVNVHITIKTIKDD